MKRYAIAAALVLFAVAIYSQPAGKQTTFAWDPMPAGEQWQAVRLYDILPSPESLVGEVTCTQVNSIWTCPEEMTVMIPRQPHNFVARSFDGFWESDDSNVVEVTVPKKIGNLKKK